MLRGAVMTPTEIIRAQLKRWAEAEDPDDRYADPKEINEGRCMDFAEELVEGLVAAGFVRAFLVDSEDHCPFMDYWHVWTFLDGRHYDSEAPEGVADWMSLPFFDRVRAADGGDVERRESIEKDAEGFAANGVFWELMRTKHPEIYGARRR